MAAVRSVAVSRPRSTARASSRSMPRQPCLGAGTVGFVEADLVTRDREHV